MPTTLTIHELEPATARLLMVYAKRESKSLDQSAKELLAIALGVKPRSRAKINNGLGKFRGCIDRRTATDILAYVENADFSRVDGEDM